MVCTKGNCIVNGNERMVSCWLCLKPFHLKCSGLKARDVDALEDPQKFLNWTCPGCRKINIEFYNFFKNSKEQFDKISEEFRVVQNKLAQFGELFSCYPNLDKFASSTVPSSSQLSCFGSPNPVDSMAVDVGPPMTNPSPSLGLAAKDLPAVSVVNSYSTVVSPQLPSQLVLPSTLSTSQPFRNNASGNASYATPSTQPSNPRILKSVPPSKMIFVSRLSSETTAEDVEFYIKSKLQTNDSGLISVYKYTYSQPRTIASFKITVPDELFNSAVDQTFWPIHTFVREYQNRKPAAHLPSTKN